VRSTCDIDERTKPLVRLRRQSAQNDAISAMDRVVGYRVPAGEPDVLRDVAGRQPSVRLAVSNVLENLPRVVDSGHLTTGH
jgi:hypothetical protein